VIQSTNWGGKRLGIKRLNPQVGNKQKKAEKREWGDRKEAFPPEEGEGPVADLYQYLKCLSESGATASWRSDLGGRA